MTIYIETGYTTGIGRNSSYTPTRAVTNTNAFVIMNSSSSDTSTQGAHRWLIKGYIDDSGDVILIKGADATATGAASYQIVSCDQGEFEVEVQLTSIASGAATATINLDVEATPGQTMVIGSQNMGASLTTSITQGAFCTFELTNSSTVTVERNTTPSVALQAAVQVVKWAPWTGVKVAHGTDSITSAIPKKTQFAHGVNNLDPESTWLITSMRHNTTGLEQCSIAASLLDDSSVASSTNIYYQRYDQDTPYTSNVTWCLVMFPPGSIQIYNAPTDDSGTGTFQVVSIGEFMTATDAICYATNTCNGTGNAFGRPRWIFVGFTISGEYILTAQFNRGYSGQASEHDVQFVALGAFKPQNTSLINFNY